MSNFFDQFDAKTPGNFFDQFDAEGESADAVRQAPPSARVDADYRGASAKEQALDKSIKNFADLNPEAKPEALIGAAMAGYSPSQVAPKEKYSIGKDLSQRSGQIKADSVQRGGSIDSRQAFDQALFDVNLQERLNRTARTAAPNAKGKRALASYNPIDDSERTAQLDAQQKYAREKVVYDSPDAVESRERAGFAEASENLSALYGGLAGAARGLINAPGLTLDAFKESRIPGIYIFNQLFTKPLIEANGVDYNKRHDNAPGSDFLKKMASDYMPKVQAMDFEEVVGTDKFLPWLTTNMAGNAPSLAMSFAAAFVPTLRPAVLPAMGAMSGGRAYADGDSVGTSTTKAAIEIGTEMLPLKVLDKVGVWLKGLPPPARVAAVAQLSKRVLQTGTAITTVAVANAVEEIAATVGGNLLDRYAEDKDVAWNQGAAGAGVLGAATGAAMASPSALSHLAAPKPIAPPSAEQMMRDRGFLAPGVTSFANPNGPASKAGITPIVVPEPQNVSIPSNTGGLATGATTGASNLAVPSVGDSGLAPNVNAGVGGGVGVTAGANAGSANVLDQNGQPSTSVNPIKRTSDKDLLSGLTYEDEVDGTQATEQASNSVIGISTSAKASVNTVPAATENAAPDSIWTGKSGSGYETQQQAQNILPMQAAKDTSLNWSVEQRQDGKFQLAGYSKVSQTVTPTQGITSAKATGSAASLAGTNEAGLSGAGLRTDAGLGLKGNRANVRGRENLGDVTAAADLSERLGRAITVATPETMRGLPANAPRARAFRVFNRFAGVANTAFGYKPVAITGLGQYGVQYDDRAYIDLDEMSDGRTESLAGMVLHTMGHEIGHSMQKSSNAEDRATYAELRKVVLQYARTGAADARQKFEDGGAVADGMAPQGRRYAEDELVNDVNGAMWRDSKFWGMLYDLDSGSTLRSVAYKFMQAATKIIGAAKKNGHNDIATLVGENIEVVREAAAKAWAERAIRKGKMPKARPALKAELFDADPSLSRKGVVGEVAPFPSEKSQEAIGQMTDSQRAINTERATTENNWNDTTDSEKTSATRDVYRKQVDRVMADMGLRGWLVEFSSGTFEGKQNPNFIIAAADNATAAQVDELAKAIGYTLDQKAMITFNEGNTSGENVAGFVKVTLPNGMSADTVKQLRSWIADKAPGAGGDTLREGSLVYGNFTAYTDLPLGDADFKQAIDDAVASFEADGEAVVSDVIRWESGYIQPDSREDYLQGTRYESDTGQVAAGGDSVRQGQGNRRTWIEGVGRDAIARREEWVDSSTSGRARAAKGRSSRADQAMDGAEREYGTAREGSVAKLGVHFSQQRRANLSSEYHGAGLKGDERTRMAMPGAIKDRLYFYMDTGKGVTPEAGVGGVKHSVNLNNLYDISKDPYGYIKMSSDPDPLKRANKWESMVSKAGFDGYAADNGGNQGFIVLLGKHNISFSRSFKGNAENDRTQQDSASRDRAEGRRESGGTALSQGIQEQPGEAARGSGQTANGQSAQAVNRLKPLPGAPNVPGFHGPDPRLLAVADEYAARAGLQVKRQTSYASVDVARATRIAQAYDDMQNAPQDAKVQEAYQNLIKQTVAQYEALERAGYKFWFIDIETDAGIEYASSPWNAMRDIRANQSMGIFSTADGFGSGDAISDNPLESTVTKFRWPKGGVNGPLQPVLANDLFRAVHDAFGHGLEGAGFRAQGEENAWQAHARLFTGSALRALTTETRGQNSWVNYGPSGQANQAASALDTVFADQKTGLLPEWASAEGLSYSRRFKSVDEFDSGSDDFDGMNELGNFNVDTNDDVDLDNLFGKKTAEQKKQAELDRSLGPRQVNASRTAAGPAAVTLEAMQDKGLYPETAFSLGRVNLINDDAFEFSEATAFPEAGDLYEVSERNGNWRVDTAHSFTGENKWSKDGALRHFTSMVTAPFIHRAGFDIASNFRKGTVLKLAQTWRNLAGKSGAFKLPTRATATEFAEVAKEMGALKNYDIESSAGRRMELTFTDKVSGATFDASISQQSGSRYISCCTMGLAGSKIGTEFYAVTSEWARNNKLGFKADATLSAINSYRRTEQATSYTLKSGDTGVTLPGWQNRVYGYKGNPKTPEDHDMNLGRLLLAGLRNATEIDPDIRRLKYDPATDKFSDAKGDAEAKVKAFLANQDARASGMGRSTLARAVLTSQIIKGGFDASAVTEFKAPVAYSRKVGLDSPLSESWGEIKPDGSVEMTPKFEEWFGDSKVVKPDGTPLVVYHGTDKDFSEFEKSDSRTGHPSSALGFYFSTKPSVADRFNRDKSNLGAFADIANQPFAGGASTLPVFLSIKNPKVLTANQFMDLMVDLKAPPKEGTGWLRTEDGWSALREQYGPEHDGVLIQAKDGRDIYRGSALEEYAADQYVAFNPTQIKSVFNNGEWDGDDARISYSRKKLDDYMEQRRKTMNLVSPQSVLDKDIDTAVKAIEIAVEEIEDGNREMPPISLGPIPHSLTLLRVQPQMLRIDASILRKVFSGKHAGELGDITPSALVRAIYQPAMILKGEQSDEYEIVTSLVTPKGVVIVPVKADAVSRESGMKSAAIMSIYARSVSGAGRSIVNRVKSGGVLYADPQQAQVAVTGRGSVPLVGINAGEAQFSRTPPTKGQGANVDDLQNSVKPINPNYVGWDRVRDIIMGGIRDKKIKTDVDLMRWIGSNYKPKSSPEGWGDAPAFARKFAAAQGLPIETKLQATQRVMQDQYNRVKLVQDIVAERGGLVGEEQDVYRAEERMHGRVTELMRQFKDDVMDPFLAKAVDAKVDLNELALYAYAKHAKERNAHIQTFNKHVTTGSGMSDDTADNIIQLVGMSGDAQAFEDLHNDMMAMTATTRLVMLDEGLITQDQYDGLNGMYEFYVPLRGFEDVDPEQGTVRPGVGRGFNVKGNETLAAMGRDSMAGDILENIVRDYERITVRAERNSVGKTFLDLVTSNPDPKLWEVQPIKRVARKGANGLVQYQTVDDKSEDTVAVKVAGQPVYIKINDDLLLRAMQNAFKGEKSDSERFVMRVAGAYTSLLRNTITRYNPIFGAINAVRDAQMGAAGVFDALGAEGLKRYSKNYLAAVAAGARTELDKSSPNKNPMDKWMREMRFAGGTTGGIFMRDYDDIQSEMRDAMLKAGMQPNGVMDWAKHSTAARAGKGVLKALEMIGATSEHAARLAAYASAREMGKSPAEAASLAKNLTVNFNRFGEQGQLINTVFLFYNASVQGSVRIAQMAKNPKMRYAAVGMAAAGFGLAMMGAAVGGDDDDGQPYWDKIPDWEKERNLIVMLPPGVDAGAKVGKNGRYFKIPMAYGLNVFPVLGYQAAGMVRNFQDPAKGIGVAKAGVNMLSAVMGSYNPFGGSLSGSPDVTWALAAAPTVADPLIQLGVGVNGFGRPMGPEKSPFDQRPDSEMVSGTKHGSVEHRIARYLNEVTGGNQARPGAIDVQPGTLKNVQGIIGGGLGNFIGDVVNLGYLGANELPVSTRDIPLVKAFYGEYDKKAGMGMYYERAKQARTELSSMEREMGDGIEREYSEEDRFLHSMGGYAESLSKAFGELKKREVFIAESPMTSKEKELARREVQKQREVLADEYNTTWFKEEAVLKRSGKM